MKKSIILSLIISIFLFIGCSKDEENNPLGNDPVYSGTIKIHVNVVNANVTVSGSQGGRHWDGTFTGITDDTIKITWEGKSSQSVTVMATKLGYFNDSETFNIRMVDQNQYH